MTSNSIAEWWIRLDGDQRDLEDVAQSFRLNATCRVDRDTDSKYYLKSVIFNELTDANDVLDCAEELVLRINGAMKAQYSDYQPVHKSGGIVTIHENGNRGVVIVPDTAVMVMRAGRVTVEISGGERSEPTPSDAERWLDLSGSDDHVADTLTYLSREANWFDLFKLFEVIRSAVGGHEQVLTRLTEGENDRAALSKKIQRFTGTANAVHDIRHARPSRTPPANPMDLREANEFTRNLANRYLQWRLKRNS